MERCPAVVRCLLEITDLTGDSPLSETCQPHPCASEHTTLRDGGTSLFGKRLDSAIISRAWKTKTEALPYSQALEYG